MFYVISQLLGMVLRPSTFLLLLSLGGLVLCWVGWRSWGRRALTVGILAMAMVELLPVGGWALRPLENRFPPVADPPAHVDGIIVLGGALSPRRMRAHGIPSLNWAAERMTAAVGLALRYPTARLVFTGGLGVGDTHPTTEADVARALFTQLGLPPDRAIYESKSRTTYENAVLSRKLVDPKPGETWILVTSASHMPRSVGAFRRAGWPVLAWPVGYKSIPELELSVLPPFGEELEELDLAAHEWGGLLGYYLTGRTDALFPGP
jgi:uncharacterized SAM-binding protein YcdF (DUF218 family)